MHLWMAIILPSFIYSAGSITPTRPIFLSTNRQDSVPVYIFYFTLANQLNQAQTITIKFKDITSIRVSSCYINSVLSDCQSNSNPSPSFPLPAVISALSNTQSVSIIVPSSLAANTQHQLQIILTNGNPPLSRRSLLFQAYSFDPIGNLKDFNYNFGTVQWTGVGASLDATLVNLSPSQSVPGTSNTLNINIKHSVAATTVLTTIRIVVSHQWHFSNNSQITAANNANYGSSLTPQLLLAPVLLSTQIIAPNLIQVVLNQSITINRQYQLTITNLQNPAYPTAGNAKVYISNFNTYQPMESDQALTLTTTANTLTCSSQLSSGLSSVAAYTGYYSGKRQSLKLKCSSTVQINNGLQIKITFSAGILVKGSVFINSYPNVVLEYTSDTILTIKNIPAISASTQFNIQFYYLHHTSTVTVTFKGTLQTTHTTLTNNNIIKNHQLFTGSLSIAGQQIQNLPNGLTVNPNNPQKVHVMGTNFILKLAGTSSTGNGSNLRIILPNSASSSSSLCTLSIPSQSISSQSISCNLVTGANHMEMTFSSPISQNYYTNDQITITITGINFQTASSLTQPAHQLFYILYYNSANSSFYQGQSSFTVVPSRAGISGLSMHLSNDVVDSSNNYPNIIRIVSQNSLPYAIGVSQKRVIQVRSSVQLNSKLSLTNQGNFFCKGSISITCSYIQGAQTSELSITQQIGWDKIIIILQGDQATAPSFHIIFPMFFPDTSPSLFQVCIGIINTVSGQRKFTNVLQAPISGSATYFTPLSVNRPDVNTNIIYMGGSSAIIANNIQVNVDSTTTFTGTNYNSALIIVAKWSVNSASWTSTYQYNGATSINKNMAIYLYYIVNSENYYLSYMPLYSTGQISNLSFFWNGVQYPFSSDLPYYNMYLTTNDGTMDCKYQYANAFSNSFYKGHLALLQVNCLSQTLLTQNTRCQIKFQANSVVLKNAVIKLITQGLTVFTNLCTLTVSGLTIKQSCQSSVDGLTLTITLSHSTDFSSGTTYQLIVHGISFTSTYPTLTLSINDNSGTYVLQQGERIIATQPQKSSFIAINSLDLSIINPLALTQLVINFTTPRSLLDDQIFIIQLGLDFNDVNTDIFQVNIQLKNLLNATIPITFNYQNLGYHLQIGSGLLNASTYIMKISGLITPASTSAKISLSFKRSLDSFVSLINLQQYTPSYPALLSATTSSITILTSNFTTEGLPQDIIFTVTLGSNSSIDYNSTILVRLPGYYSVTGWNLNSLYCQVNGITCSCKLGLPSPFTIQLYNIPVLLSASSSFTFGLFGMTTPQLSLSQSSSTLKFFVGIKCLKSDNSFCQYSNVNAPSVNAITSLGQVIVHGISFTNLFASDKSFCQIVLQSTVAVNSSSKIYLNFPAAFTSFNGQTLQISQSLQGVTNSTTTNVSVDGRRLQVSMSISVSINTKFQLAIQSLPNPPTSQTVKMSQLQVLQTDNAGVIVASSLKQTNLAGSLQFISIPKSIIINNNSPIILTYGTYTTDIQIKPNPGPQFETNIQLNFSANGLTFVPQTLQIGIGSSKAYFKVGGDVNLLLTNFSYNITKSQQSGTTIYTIPSNLIIQVIDSPISISTPSVLNVPKGGCSVPSKIALTNRPFTQITINYQYNSSQYNQSLFFINQITSNFNMRFSPSSQYQLLSFCTTTLFNQTSLTVGLTLSGIQQQSYTLTSSTIVLSFNTVASIVPTLILLSGVIQRKQADFIINCNQEGSFYYQYYITGTANSSSLIDLQLKSKNQSIIIQKGGSMLPTVYQRLRDHRVGILSVTAGNNSIAFDELYPATSYTLCGYLLTQYLQGSQSVCLNFSTAGWGPFSKALFSFNKNISKSQMNRLLCYLTKKVSTKSQLLINSQGQSCSFTSFPQNKYYSYTGSTSDKSNRMTNIYLLPDPQQGIDSAVAQFDGLFDSSGTITSVTLSDALTSSTIGFIQNALKKQSLQHSISLLTNIGNLTIKQNNPLLTLYNVSTACSASNACNASYASVVLENISISQPGSYYVILVREKYIIKSQNTTNRTLKIRSNPTPTARQVLQCKDYYDIPADGCGRIIITDTQIISLNISGLEIDSLYRMFKVFANQYPLFPANNLSVENVSFATVIGSMIKGLIGIVWIYLI